MAPSAFAGGATSGDLPAPKPPGAMGGPPAPPPAPEPAGSAEPPSTFREPAKKTVGEGYEKRELRKLTPEEKARRKIVWNLVMGGGGMLFIAFVGWLLWPARRKRQD